VFLTYAKQIAEAEERLTGKTARVEFLQTLGENLGLAAER
jgi:hypothetical protein